MEKETEQLVTKFPLIKDLINLKEVTWFNQFTTKLKDGLPYVSIDASDVKNADARLRRFAPFLYEAFPETQSTQGIIESEIVAIPTMQKTLEQLYDVSITGKVLLKKDSHLPISGSIKARGGIYAVLKHAEKLAIDSGILSESDNYSRLLSEEFKQFFKNYSIAVGSTGNLGLSIGIIGTKLGFNVSVYMSHDVREWKKERLRSHGVNVFECGQDYSVAIEMGRKKALTDQNTLFIDDENSKTLFLGYAVAGERVKTQFEQMNIMVDEDHPLFVYLPCGVGGSPGGVAFGLKLALGDHVHCFFAEPTHSPCMLLGLYTGLHNKISVYDIGIDNITAADGLAVARASGFVGPAVARLLDGCYTIDDQQLYDLLSLLSYNENIQLEPSSLAGMVGPARISLHDDYLNSKNFSIEKMKQATHLVWATGGSMVPPDEMKKYINLSNISPIIFTGSNP